MPCQLATSGVSQKCGIILRGEDAVICNDAVYGFGQILVRVKTGIEKSDSDIRDRCNVRQRPSAPEPVAPAQLFQLYYHRLHRLHRFASDLLLSVHICRNLWINLVALKEIL